MDGGCHRADDRAEKMDGDCREACHRDRRGYSGNAYRSIDKQRQRLQPELPCLPALLKPVAVPLLSVDASPQPPGRPGICLLVGFVLLWGRQRAGLRPRAGPRPIMEPPARNGPSTVPSGRRGPPVAIRAAPALPVARRLLNLLPYRSGLCCGADRHADKPGSSIGPVHRRPKDSQSGEAAVCGPVPGAQGSLAAGLGTVPVR